MNYWNDIWQLNETIFLVLSSTTFLVLSDGKILKTKAVEKEKEKIFLLSQIRFILELLPCMEEETS